MNHDELLVEYWHNVNHEPGVRQSVNLIILFYFFFNFEQFIYVQSTAYQLPYGFRAAFIGVYHTFNWNIEDHQNDYQHVTLYIEFQKLFVPFFLHRYSRFWFYAFFS